MPNYRLTYFNVKALGEGIRNILSYMEVDWEDVRIEPPMSPTSPWKSELKNETKYGKLPVLEIDGKKLYQSAAICRYLASEAGLLGSNPWENLQIDTIGGTLMDLKVAIQTTIYEPNKAVKAEMMNTLKEKTVPYYVKTYEDAVQENNGYLANGKLSWVDFYVIGYLETAGDFTGVTIFDEKNPNLNALKNKLYSIPSVKKWIDKRPKTL